MFAEQATRILVESGVTVSLCASVRRRGGAWASARADGVCLRDCTAFAEGGRRAKVRAFGRHLALNNWLCLHSLFFRVALSVCEQSAASHAVRGECFMFDACWNDKQLFDSLAALANHI